MELREFKFMIYYIKLYIIYIYLYFGTACTLTPGRLHGQPKFLLRDGIAAGIFFVVYSGSAAGLQPWEVVLQNSPEVLELLLNRMKKDFESQSSKMRKPWGLKELAPCLLLASATPILLGVYCIIARVQPKSSQEVLQRVCCAFRACLLRFKELVPSSFHEKVEPEIMSTSLRYYDGRKEKS